ncbi:hypothetical protein ACIA78_31850 [Streptomyces xanthochromogenes]|uniref:hypothetical protein n=1 Tax=Streptomyces xanthochromogenes TaxID=67384 RepID=UPI003796DF11
MTDLERIEQSHNLSPGLRGLAEQLAGLVRIQRGKEESGPELIREGLSIPRPTAALQSTIMLLLHRTGRTT